MPPDWLDPLFRWTHVIAGILWIGLLYFFNWVNGPFMATLDADTKRKVVPELMPRTLYWFRWGAAFTWVTGIVLLAIIFYHGRLVFEDMAAPHWDLSTFVMLAVVFGGVFVYDALVNSVLKNPKASFFGGWILASAVVYLMAMWPHFSVRGYAIHLGAMFGTFMAFNVWYRIWPAQIKIITAIKNGEAPDGALVALAGTRSKHNTYMSIPLVFAMLDMHTVIFAVKPWHWSIVILLGWTVCYLLYAKSKQVKGF